MTLEKQLQNVSPFLKQVIKIYKNFEEVPVFMTVPQAAEVLGISAVSLYKLIQNDKSFPVISIGRRKTVPKEQLKVWINSNCKRQFVMVLYTEYAG